MMAEKAADLVLGKTPIAPVDFAVESSESTV
jgi:hypothetical protein